ncbi:TrbM/KikA/MpfK family conjugal transfer protein [Pseudomonas chengduensis]|uniref:TrbM/KikA/MpfK family conjugal transfer protein n=1 Tax=Pseudomonas sp. o96-267 TaxID=2479853 RepID=UPI000F7A4606|nr:MULTISPECIES: TrbM/KikA/MpfK family conjugal transfer protein [Pseudomonas]MDH0960907.1 TrbM/KikA/MpfK family conjugal transfer protein [Pseudomonas chengduensis]MDV5863675.1 TrbM/KikA/MpfK family conjugal transfer protein [Pseudomonas mendocina]
MKNTIFAFLALAVALPMAANASPCGAELCLSDFEAAKESDGACDDEMDSFFEIVERHKGHFSPSKTLKKRRDYLYKCESGNKMDKERILAKFGSIIKPSY